MFGRRPPTVRTDIGEPEPLFFPSVRVIGDNRPVRPVFLEEFTVKVSKRRHHFPANSVQAVNHPPNAPSGVHITGHQDTVIRGEELESRAVFVMLARRTDYLGAKYGGDVERDERGLGASSGVSVFPVAARAGKMRFADQLVREDARAEG